MISVSDALSHLFDLVTATEVEAVPLRQAAGRVLARDVVATRTQPPFAASSMDGYALRQTEVEPDAMFKVIGEAAAGHRFDGVVKAGQAVRIFTGAPVPEGADFVVIQEDTTRRGDLIMLGHDIGPKTNIRPAGGDFHTGDTMDAPRLLRVHKFLIQLAGIFEGVEDRRFCNLVKDDALHRTVIESQRRDQVPRDGFPFAVFVGCKEDGGVRAD